MKRALVTGAAGFLGRACVRALNMRGYQVSGVGRRPAPDGFKGTDWLCADLLNTEDRKRLLADARPTHLVHLAWDVASASYLQSRENERWSAASVDLLDRALDFGVQRIVGAGTCLEYGPADRLCHEVESTCQPTTAYGGAKLEVAEAFVRAGNAGARVAWGRIFKPYGPGEPAAKLLPSLLRTLDDGREFACSHGNQIRDFIYLEDLALAMAKLLDSAFTGLINLASGEPRSLRSVISHFAELVGRKDLVRFGAVAASGVDNDPRIVADATRLKSVVGTDGMLGWDEGSRRTVQLRRLAY